jgi:hypothetical protein
VIRHFYTCILILFCFVCSAKAGNSYQAVILNPSGFVESDASGISSGQQVGLGNDSTMGDYWHALLWSNTAQCYTDLNPTGFSESGISAVSGGRQAGAGYSISTNKWHALLWSSSAANYVDLHPTGFTESCAYGIFGNQQAGEGWDIGNKQHALLWSGSAGSCVDLHPGRFKSSVAWNICGSQQVGEGWDNDNNWYALLWSGSAASCVELHPNGFVSSSAFGVCNGRQVGEGWDSNNNRHALLWSGSSESCIDLNPAGFTESSAYGIFAGQQVGAGSSTTGNNRHALLWSGSAASYVDLHKFLPAEYASSEAFSIDPSGNIVGTTKTSDGLSRAVMWVSTGQLNAGPDELNSLEIKNIVKQFEAGSEQPDANEGFVIYLEKSGSRNGLDPNDQFYDVPDNNCSQIVSLIPNTNLQKKVIDYYLLSKDARPFPSDPNDPNSKVVLELSIHSPGPNNLNINSENYFMFWLADINSFADKPVTIQQVSSDSNTAFPIWDVKNIISKHCRKLPLDNLSNQKPDKPYAWFTLSTSRQIADIDDNGFIDVNDYRLLLVDFGKTGVFRSDIASCINYSLVSGIPDSKVDESDQIAFIAEYSKNHAGNQPPNPLAFTEGFESGQIQTPLATSGNVPWSITSSGVYAGNFSARSGVIGNSQTSILTITRNCIIGKISFAKKVSSEPYYDSLTFYIDGVEKGRWSGWEDWGEVSYNTTMGIHTFKWIYSKDPTVVNAKDAAWIDNLKIE